MMSILFVVLVLLSVLIVGAVSLLYSIATNITHDLELTCTIESIEGIVVPVRGSLRLLTQWPPPRNLRSRVQLEFERACQLASRYLSLFPLSAQAVRDFEADVNSELHRVFADCYHASIWLRQPAMIVIENVNALTPEVILQERDVILADRIRDREIRRRKRFEKPEQTTLGS